MDQAAIARSRAALGAYLRAFPQGSYAASASGLQRRVLWLSGDMDGLAREYARLAESVPAGSEAAASLVEEVDNKLLFAFGEAGQTTAQGALLLAAQDLVRMRDYRGEEGGEGPGLTLAQLEAQRATFAGRPDLWTYLQASHAFHVGKDPRRVLELVPDDARRPAYAPLAFSRQVLRGMALAALKDRNEAGFWLELLGGATALWQRPTVELALAMNYERNGKLGAVFAPGSPITDSDIRMILLAHSAGPGLLRAQALDGTRPAAERLVAVHTLLDKQLRHGDFASFAASLRLPVPTIAEGAVGLAANAGQQVDAFAKGRWSDGYPCPALAETARLLAANPASVPARLCLGDFWRLNGFDPYPYDSGVPEPDELGGVAREFPGRPATRASLYDAIIADPRARPDDRAYALYRAINCYGPSGNNGCGGEDVPLAQRRAWFQRLKREFPASQWAKRQRIYW